jgi:hypothetical protein
MRSTPALVIVFLLILQRWVDMRTGWPEWMAFPAVALAGTLLVDRLVLPSHSRLDARSWLLNVALAAGIGVLLFALSP